MRKTIIILVSIFLMLCLAACTYLGLSIPDLPNKDSQATNTAQDEIAVMVTAKKNLPVNTKEGRYTQRVEFVFEVENLTDKPIKGVQGQLRVYDLFDNKITEFDCDFTGNTIPAHSTVTIDTLGLDINQFNDRDVKLYNEKFDDLKFSYVVISIVYGVDQPDSQTNSATDTPHADIVDVKVTNKYNLDEDYSAGRYQKMVCFDFQVTNTGAKAIKGIQGTLVVKDLFGEEIIQITCDFTGNTISQNSSITVSDLGIEINQFMDDHAKLYKEKYGDLHFDYIIKAIVYTDGTTDNFE